MKLHAIDAAIILIYFLFAIGAGIWVARRGAKDLNSYFLGGKTLPWYYLGVSNALGMFRYFRHDVAGVCAVHLRPQEHLAAVGLADLQPDFPDDFRQRLAAAFQRADRGGMDSRHVSAAAPGRTWRI